MNIFDYQANEQEARRQEEAAKEVANTERKQAVCAAVEAYLNDKGIDTEGGEFCIEPCHSIVFPAKFSHHQYTKYGLEQYGYTAGCSNYAYIGVALVKFSYEGKDFGFIVTQTPTWVNHLDIFDVETEVFEDEIRSYEYEKALWLNQSLRLLERLKDQGTKVLSPFEAGVGR